jgi:hypothetical protein
LRDSETGKRPTPSVSPKKSPGNRWGQEIPRRGRNTDEAWQITALRGLLPVLAVIGFLALAVVLSVLTYDLTGSAALSVIVAAAALAMAALFGQRVVVRILDLFS